MFQGRHYYTLLCPSDLAGYIGKDELIRINLFPPTKY